jgi:hypothetical protein
VPSNQRGCPSADARTTRWSPRQSQHILLEGGLKGQRGFFTRNEIGAVVGADLAGRIATRVSAK